MHAQYKLERQGVKLMETHYGFVSYQEADGALCALELFVLPAYRGRGLGKDLMERARDLAEAQGLKFITVIDPNDQHSPALRKIFSQIGMKYKQQIPLQMELYVKEVS
jgi:GNAT superfamily N-acetyltransferase